MTEMTVDIDKDERLAADLIRFQSEGAELAGELGDFQQRAGAYRELYRHSNGNFVFPLIAAHGALWGAGHMRHGLAFSQLAAKVLRLSRSESARRLAMVHAFTDVLKDINRQVLIMTYTAYQMTRYHGQNPNLADYIPRDLIAPLVACHAARREGRQLDPSEKRVLYQAAFIWEQSHVVGPRLDAALQDFNWPMIRALSLRPPIGFTYFGPFRRLWFRNFANRAERLKHGLRAYDIAVRRGLLNVEHMLMAYDRPRANVFNGFVCPTYVGA